MCVLKLTVSSLPRRGGYLNIGNAQQEADEQAGLQLTPGLLPCGLEMTLPLWGASSGPGGMAGGPGTAAAGHNHTAVCRSTHFLLPLYTETRRPAKVHPRPPRRRPITTPGLLGTLAQAAGIRSGNNTAGTVRLSSV